MTGKLKLNGKVISVQPRIRLQRSFDQSSHTYQGYSLGIDGEIGDQRQKFSLGIGKATQAKFAFRVGDSIEGLCLPVGDPDRESVEFYEASALRVHERGPDAGAKSPPWHDIPPTIETYRERGHRRLAQKAYETECGSCIWACDMAVEMIIDQWNPSNVRYRRETFCYGPKSCPIYKPGPTRKVPGRRGMVWIEEDWVDEQETAHRGPDD